MWNRHACGLVAGTVLMGSAFAQPAERAWDAESPMAAARDHLVHTHAAIAAFDRDTDGRLDASERADLAARIDEGTWTLVPFRTRPGASAPPPAVLRARMDWVYTMTTPFDLNRDGTLDDEEQRALEAGLACLAVPPRLQPGTGCAGVPACRRGTRPVEGCAPGDRGGGEAPSHTNAVGRRRALTESPS